MKKVLGVLLVSMAFSACYYDKEEDLYPNDFNAIGATNYSTVIRPIIASNCATSSCHVAGVQAPDLSTYQGLKDNIDRVRIRAIELKTMPTAGPMTDINITKLKTWIANGAQNN